MKKDVKKIRVAVGMSGGVDSSVAAALLKEQGYDVIGVFLHFWKENVQGAVRDNICCSLESQEDARRGCGKLKIPFYTMNVAAPFKKEIVNDFLNEYKGGRTPNPCVRCNRFIKFGEFLKRAKVLGAEFVATGHYARVEGQRAKVKGQKQGQKTKGEGQRFIRYMLMKGVDKVKDQSYFLHGLTQEQLAHVLFPVGDLTKQEVRKLAAKYGLPTASKRESQEICFIPSGDLAEFLKRHMNFVGGEIRDVETNKVLGKHNGLSLYTIGQRKGIGLAGGPWYAVRLDKAKRVLWVSTKEENILSSTCVVKNTNWIMGVEPEFPLTAECRIRYGAENVSCVITKGHEEGLAVKFSKPQRAVTPGQYCVFYKDEECLGGGVIA